MPTADLSARTRARMFWTYWAASTTSSVGSAVTGVALPLIALTVLDAGALEVGLLAACGYAAWLVIGLPAGVMAQRLPLRGTQVALDLLRALAVALGARGLVGWAAEPGAPGRDRAGRELRQRALRRQQLHVPAPDRPARGAAGAQQPDLRHPRRRPSSAGRALGGLLVQVLGAVPTLLVDAVTYVVSAVLLRSLPPRRSSGPTPGPAWAR